MLHVDRRRTKVELGEPSQHCPRGHFGRISNRNREIGMKVDLTTKVLCLKASIHFLIISNLHFLLAFALTIASVYTYFTCPSDLFGMPVPPEDVKKTKEDLIMKALGGFALIPFIVLSFISGFMSCFNYTPFYALSTLLSFGLAVIILCYDAYVLFYLKLKYVWPPFLLNDVQVVLPPGSPFTNEEVLVYFAKVQISAVTFCMLAVVSTLLYCSFVSANLSFLYKSPEPAPRVHRRFSVKRREDVEEDVDETGPDEHEKEGNREEVKKTDGSEKKKNDNEEEMKKTTETGDQTGTGTGAD
ncbi:hypothetical protein L5515_001781 [Caenorhabditis briggsae]|uniref:Uncharacterized protein n=1 Tax=Caenorhabditis briggsae TaxID=6238 RepID=A0AAE9J3E3_CAEBR|nr:hypothetical protein L5515_001781 [Caenorhabditis briggsae]